MNALDPSVTRERPTYRWHLFRNGDWRSCNTTVPFTVHPWTFGYTIAHASIQCLLTDSTDAWKIFSVISSLRVTHASLIEITIYLPPFTNFPVVALPTSLVPTKHWKRWVISCRYFNALFTLCYSCLLVGINGPASFVWNAYMQICIICVSVSFPALWNGLWQVLA